VRRWKVRRPAEWWQFEATATSRALSVDPLDAHASYRKGYSVSPMQDMFLPSLARRVIQDLPRDTSPLFSRLLQAGDVWNVCMEMEQRYIAIIARE